MNQIQPINQNGQRVLTSAQLAEVYGADVKKINNNFLNNHMRYQEGKHYFTLTGHSLKEFLQSQNLGVQNQSKIRLLYLWTEKGAWLHAKSLNTDQAWDAYEMLVDEYYTVKENVTPLSKEKALVTVLRTTADLVESHDSIIKGQHEIRKLITSVDNKVDEQITLTSGEQRRLQKGVAIRVYEFTKDKKEAAKLFRELYREIKDRFGVASYKDVKKKELLSAIRYIENWIPRKVS